MNCPDCQVEPGYPHIPGCDVERCPFCGGQLISCSCSYKMLGEKYGWTYMPMMFLDDKDEVPEGYTCDRKFRDGRSMYSYPFSGLPEEVWENGLTEEMEKYWDSLLEPEGFILWDGTWPGKTECQEFGWYSKMGPNGWETCSKDDPEASEDLNRLYGEAVWSRKQKRFVLAEDK